MKRIDCVFSSNELSKILDYCNHMIMFYLNSKFRIMTLIPEWYIQSVAGEHEYYVNRAYANSKKGYMNYEVRF